mmetsp:Transcript_16262/g.18418  ORF Transcript_16262/g.18418 Transcript_16262/m.18418 type:complete len:211 (+) Transcript_16262:255-887(+)
MEGLQVKKAQKQTLLELFSQPSTLLLLMLLDALLHKKSSVFGRLLVFGSGFATAGPAFRGLRRRKLRWNQYGISETDDAHANEIVANLLLRNSWNRTVAGTTCMIVSMGNLENHAIAVILLGLQKLGSLGVISTNVSLGADQLSEKSKVLLTYDIKTALICLLYGLILLDRKRRRDRDPLNMLTQFHQRLNFLNVNLPTTPLTPTGEGQE